MRQETLYFYWGMSYLQWYPLNLCLIIEEEFRLFNTKYKVSAAESSGAYMLISWIVPLLIRDATLRMEVHI